MSRCRELKRQKSPRTEMTSASSGWRMSGAPFIADYRYEGATGVSHNPGQSSGHKTHFSKFLTAKNASDNFTE